MDEILVHRAHLLHYKICSTSGLNENCTILNHTANFQLHVESEI